MDKTYFAKSPKKDGTQETVREHLQNVENLAREYGRAFNVELPASLCGLLHDFGKYSSTFQNVLKGMQTNIDHAICGAAFLHSFSKKAFDPLIEAIAAHHSQLISHEDLDTVLDAVLMYDTPVTTKCGKQAALCGSEAYKEAVKAFQTDFPDFPSKVKYVSNVLTGQKNSMLYTRMLFSCLVDADYTASSEDPVEDGRPLDVLGALQKLYTYCESLRKRSQAGHVLNKYRNKLFDCCGKAGEQSGGLFTLTAPTGTGKTLALLHFALRHCQYTGKRRIIIVLPFLSLIEQTADVYRKIINPVMEDHSQSKLSEEMREHAARWDQPFIITTSVRFFEALFSDHPTECRKLHNIANSVIIFDEAQSLPISLLAPTLRTVQELCEHFNCSMVFSTATQPYYAALDKVDWSAKELLPEHQHFYKALRRTKVQWDIDEPVSLEEIAKRMANNQNLCTIVNLRAHAKKLFLALKDYCPEDEIFLISTDLCPAHRTEVIKTIRQRQKDGLPCRIVSTQCIEAGVDLDFDKMYRALAPLEAIIQAAGRCNRNGEETCGDICVFIPKEEHLYPDSHYENGANFVISMQIDQPIDIHNPECISKYYTKLFSTFRGDEKSNELEIAIADRDFHKVSEKYCLIEQQGIQVIVPYKEENELYQKLRGEALKTGLTKSLLHQALPLTITSYNRELVERFCEPLYFANADRLKDNKSTYYILLSGQEHCYDTQMGFCLPEEKDVEDLLW